MPMQLVSGQKQQPTQGMKRQVYAIQNLPTLPVIAQRILSVADDEDSGSRRLTEIIRSDPSMTARVLGLANSAYYGNRGQVATLNHAVVLIGTQMLKQLALSSIIMRSVGMPPSLGDARSFWKHSLATAMATGFIAQGHRIETPEICFVSGLLHDIGKVVLAMQFPSEFAEARHRVGRLGCPLIQAEQEVTGIDHCQVGSWLGHHWQLPSALIHAIAHHHAEDFGQSGDVRLIAAVSAANDCARISRIGCGGDRPVDEVRPATLQTLRINDAEVVRILAHLDGCIPEIENFLCTA